MEPQSSESLVQNNLQDDYDYSLVFCNPNKPRCCLYRLFTALFRSAQFPMDTEDARDYFFSIFRISLETKKDHQLDAYFTDIKANLDTFLKVRRERDVKVNFPEFTELVFECIRLLLEDYLGLEVLKPFASKSLNEVYFDIKAPESILKQEAARVSYRLQFSHLSEEKEPYQAVPPYIAFHVGKDLEELLKPYKGSLFNDIDRIRLIASVLDSKLDRRVLYSLGILLSEVCLSSKHNSEDDSFVSKGESADDRMRMTYGGRTALLYCWHQYFYMWWFFPGCVGLILFSIRFCLDISENQFSVEWNSGVGRDASLMYLAFAVVLFIYSSINVAMWRRKECRLAWRWGITGVPVIEPQRVQFKGEWEEDKVLGLIRKRRQTEMWSEVKRTVIFLLILVLIVADISLVALVFAYNTTLRSTYDRVWGGFLNGIQAKTMGFIYSFVAQLLNDWENIEFEREYYNALCIKQFLFQFVNAYASLFYIAFVKSSAEGCTDDNCLYELNIQFLTIFGVFWGVNLIKNLGLICYPRFKTWWKLRKYNKIRKEYDQKPITSLNLRESERQYSAMLHHESPMQDHLDFVILYGYIVMFSVCFPLASFLLAITAVCDWVCRRYTQVVLIKHPFPHYAKGVGIWNKVMLFINIIAAFTNPAIVIFTAKALHYTTEENVWITFVMTSLGLLLVKLLLNQVLPKMPRDVASGLAWGNRMVQKKLFGNNEHRDLQNSEVKRFGVSPHITDTFYQVLRKDLPPKFPEDVSEAQDARGTEQDEKADDDYAGLEVN